MKFRFPLYRIRTAFDAWKNSDPKQAERLGTVVKFFAVMLILTLTARGIAGASMPRVTLGQASAGSITQSSTASGTISVQGGTPLTAPEGLLVAQVTATTGQALSKGDAIARFDEVSLEQALATKQAQVKQLEVSARQLSDPEEADGFALQQAQQQLERAYFDAQKTWQDGENAIEKARQQRDAAQNALNALQNQPVATPESAEAERQQKIAEAKAALDAAESALAAAQKNAEDANEAATDTAQSYAQQFDRMVEEGVVSTRGLKQDAYVFDELVFDVNTDYFETHGGYEYAKQFYAEVYELAKKIAGGEQYIISAVMHADERNREASDRLGRDVFHYHLHVVYLPVVEKQICWSKRCKDPALRGTVRETIMQVSHSKKWPMVPMTNEQGQPVLKKNGKPRLVSSYSLLQTEFFEHMRQAGFTDFERGIKGSDAEHLNVLEYKVQKDRQTVAELSDQTKQLQGKRKELISQVKNISGSIRDVADIEQRAKTKGVLEKRVELPVQDFQTLCKMAKASGKLQAENRSLWMQLQQSTVREQELGQRLRRCEEQLDAVLTETRPYREAVRVAPEQVQAFVLGICRRQQEEKRLNRQQRRQRAKGQDR